MEAGSVLLVSNLPDAQFSRAYVHGLELMRQRGEIAGIEVVHAGARSAETPRDRAARVASAVHASQADTVLAMSLGDLVQDMDRVRNALSGRRVIYWEGDPFGPEIPIGPGMAAWLSLSSVVFSVGGTTQAERLIRHGASIVHHTIHTYNHVYFHAAESGDLGQADRRVGFLGSNLARVPLISGVSGSFGRWHLVTAMTARHRGEFLLGGPGWPARLSTGRVPFPEQARFLQRMSLMTNWDHFPDIESYTSDRLAICMIAARPQVSTLHPHMEFFPAGDQGVFLEPSVGRVIRKTNELLERPADELIELGRAAHRWARNRVSHREAVRHMLSRVFGDVEPPPPDPWGRLPGPWPVTKRLRQ